MSENDPKKRMQVMVRHESVSILIDRLKTLWDVCSFDEEWDKYQPVDESWSKELSDQLQWLKGLLEHAIAHDGDVRGYIGTEGAPSPPTVDRLDEGMRIVGNMVYELHERLVPKPQKQIAAERQRQTDGTKPPPAESGELPSEPR